MQFINFSLKFVNRYSWAIPNSLAIETLKKYGPILEIGAGNGYWAYLLRAAGGEIVAYDNFSWEKIDSRYVTDTPRWIDDIYEGDETNIPYYPEHTLFLCYPPTAQTYPLGSRALKLYSGEFVIYVGGEKGGPTGDDEFFDILSRDFTQIEKIAIPRWPGHSVAFYVYKRTMSTPIAAAKPSL